MKPFMKMGSIPIDLLNEDFPNKAMFFTKSPIKSGTCKSLLSKFLRMEISSVGRELLLVMSAVESSDFPFVKTLPKTLRAACSMCFLSELFRSFGVNWNT